MIKLAPSILSADFSILGPQLDNITKAGADYIHLDIMDGHFVPNISIGFPIIQSLRKQSSLVFDVHLMVDNPKAFITRFAQAGADIITFHVECCADASEVLEIIGMVKAAGKKVGLALRPETPLNTIFDFVPHVDMILIMSVNPGFGGQEFIQESFTKARELRDYADVLDHDLDIQMDGGINLTNVKAVLESGVNVVVVGSAIFDNANIYAAARKYKRIFRDHEKTENKIIIIANGEMDNAEDFIQIAQSANFVICCDGGAAHAAKMGIVPHLIVGDLDSLDEAVKADFVRQGVKFEEYSAEKNATDLELAMEFALQKSPDEILILGGYGGRVDHFLGNIQALIFAAKADIKVSLADAATSIFVIDKFVEIARENYDYLSLIPLEAQVTGVTTSGLKYPLRAATLHLGSTVGISNEFLEDVATITVENGLLLAVCTKSL